MPSNAASTDGSTISRAVQPKASVLPIPAAESASRRAHYPLVIGDVRVRIDDDFRDDTLTRILRVLRAC